MSNYSVCVSDCLGHDTYGTIHTTYEEARKEYEEEVEKMRNGHPDYQNEWWDGSMGEEEASVELCKVDEEGIYLDTISGWTLTN